MLPDLNSGKGDTMRDAVLILVTFSVFFLGFFIMKRIDAFMENNQRANDEQLRKSKSILRIAVESPSLVDSIAPAMECCCWGNPCLGFSVSSGKPTLMLQRLENGTVDLLLLGEETAEALDPPLSSIRIQGHSCRIMANSIPVEDETGESCICVLWNQSVSSPDRDRMVFALNNDFPVG